MTSTFICSCSYGRWLCLRNSAVHMVRSHLHTSSLSRVFGYGSLIWRPGDLPFKQRRWGYIKGWKRRFWQGSTDHRGVPGNPGRVVTLIRDEVLAYAQIRSVDQIEITWGIAYEIAAEDWPRAAEYLDFRERGGYSRSEIEVHGHIADQAAVPLRAILYVAEVANSNYLGPASIEEIARTISVSVGPSGPNIDYLRGLAHALRDNKIDDVHIVELLTAVEALLSQAKDVAKSELTA